MNPLRAHITSHDKIMDVCAQVRPTHLIVVYDHGDTCPDLPAVPSILTLEFNDFESDAARGPEMRHVQEVIQCVKDLQNPSDLVVACTAGQSRSAAIALAVTCMLCGDNDEPIEIYKDLEGFIFPNTRLVKLFVHKMEWLDNYLLRCCSRHFNSQIERLC